MKSILSRDLPVDEIHRYLYEAQTHGLRDPLTFTRGVLLLGDDFFA